MAVLGAVCHSGDTTTSEHFLCVYVCFVHMCFHLHTHTERAHVSVAATL